MNSTSLAADGSHWWRIPAAAGAAATGLIAAILLVPAIGADAPPVAPPAPTVVVPTSPERHCFMGRHPLGGRLGRPPANRCERP